jgi:hypothetical protein
VLLAATLGTRTGDICVKLRNLSAEGALVEGEKLPVEGSRVTFQRGDIAEKAHVVWVDGKQAGVAFDQQLQPEQVLRNVPTPRPRFRPEFKRPGLSSRELTPEERRLIDSWACGATPVGPAR